MVEHAGMGNRAGNVMSVQALVKTDRGRESFNKIVGQFVEAAARGF